MFDLTMDSGIARLAINRPETRNAIPLEGWAKLAEAVDNAESSGVRMLVLAGEPGGSFCSGADIADFDRFRDDAAARSFFRNAIRGVPDRLRDVPIPTVAHIEGGCYGAGVALAIACDIRVADSGARFAITPDKIGISYPQQDVSRLVSLVGPGQAARLLFGAQVIDGAEAQRIGLVEIHRESGAGDAVAELCASFLANDVESLRVLKRGVGLAGRGIADDARQDQEFDDLLGAQSVFERLAAHRNRRR
jgi:enoyl-CoA hydratase/carnithine racemase